jgi:formimidoylglutamate deiminase
MESPPTTSWLPDLIYTRGRFESGVAISCDSQGAVSDVSANIKNAVRFNNRALLPGLINSHSHAFQRVIRGCTEHRKGARDSFWTWREAMYSAASRLTPEDVYDASCMAFLEMALSGITTVGEFHYLHHWADGKPYADPNLLGKAVIRAARDVGLRIALLRVAYARSGFQTDSNPQQRRFIEPDAETYLTHTMQLQSELATMAGQAWLGIAPHSVRALPLEYLKEIVRFAGEHNLIVHMHVAEQPAEVVACVEEHGRSPVALLGDEGLLSERFTAVHAIHLTSQEVDMLARTHAIVCACPTTERNLGDGAVPAESYFKAGVPICLGSDSQVEIDLLEDARELEYHLRLQKMERSILAPTDGSRSGLAARLFECATISGSRSLQANAGEIYNSRYCDFFTIDLDDPSIAGSTTEDLISNIVFSLSRSAVRDVVVGGKVIVEDGRHRDQDEIVKRFKALQKRLWL